jgi:hypothetical protein
MSGFRKAKAEQAAIKMALYGPPGSGKTMTSLLIAEGLAARDGKRVAYIDTERGTDFYCQAVPSRAVHPKGFDFDSIYTRSITEVLQAVKTLDTKIYSVIVIDSITHIWEAARAAYAGRQTKIGTIPMQAWGAIKKPYKDILAMLLSSPTHVLICGRQGVEYATDEETDELKAIGYKMKAEGETAYEPHILIRMESLKPRHANATAQIVAYAEKDRTGVLAGRSFVSPTFETICGPLMGLLGGTQATIKSQDDVAAGDAEAIEMAEREKNAHSIRLLRQMTAKIELCDNATTLKKVGAEITPTIKSQMRPEDVAELRAAFLKRSGELPDAEKHHAQERDFVADSSPGRLNAAPPHDPGTGEISAGIAAEGTSV